MYRIKLMKNRRNIIIVAIGIMAVVCIMAFPVLYFKGLDKTKYNTRHSMEKINLQLDTDVENVLMVKRLHTILGSPYGVKSTTEVDSGQNENECRTVTKNQDGARPGKVY